MLIRKMLRDVWQNKAQFIAIFLMIFLGVFIYAGVNSEWNGLSVSSQRYYQKINLADAWGMGEQFSKTDVEKLKKQPSIQSVERRTKLPVHVRDNVNKKIDLHILERYQISSMQIIKGEKYDSKIDGIWLDIAYAKETV